MSKCVDSKIGKYLSDYISDSIDIRRKKEFEDHLFFCDSCSKDVELLNNFKFIYKANRDEILKKYMDVDLIRKIEDYKAKEKIARLTQKVKQLAKNFIQEIYPYELQFFKMFWNALKDIQNVLLSSSEALMSALSITDAGIDEKELITPIAIATTIITFRELSEKIDKIEKSELISEIKKIAKKNMASEKLATELSEYIAEQIVKTRNKH